jgi:hypothetical protein
MMATIATGTDTNGRTGPDLPRVLYTGTGSRYLRDMLLERGEFVHGGEEQVYLTQGEVTAMSYAAQRAKFYGDSPVVLVVDTHKLTEGLNYDGEYRARMLNVGSFLPYEFTPNEDDKFGREEYLGLIQLNDMVTQSSEDEIRRQIEKFLSRTL